MSAPSSSRGSSSSAAEQEAEKAYRAQMGYDDDQGVDNRDLSWFTAGFPDGEAKATARAETRHREVVEAALNVVRERHQYDHLHAAVDALEAALASYQQKEKNG